MAQTALQVVEARTAPLGILVAQILLGTLELAVESAAAAGTLVVAVESAAAQIAEAGML